MYEMISREAHFTQIFQAWTWYNIGHVDQNMSQRRETKKQALCTSFQIYDF